jgi:thioredoxin 1
MSVRAITAAEFEEQVLKSETPILVDFWATWCGPCKMMAPILEDISFDLSGEVSFAAVNVDKNTSLGESMEIMSIPTMIVYVNGKEVDRVIGATSKQSLTKILEKHYK